MKLLTTSHYSRFNRSAPPLPITMRTSLSRTRPGLSYLRESIKLCARAGANLAATRDWFAYWNSSHTLRHLAHAEPAVLKKIYRPYLSRRFDCQARMQLLAAHYGFIHQHGLSDLVWRAAQAPVHLADVPGKSGRVYQLELAAMGRMEREGELVLQLVADQVVIFSLAFTFVAHDGPLAVAIGCLQGGRSEHAREAIRLATRELAGLRPKTLLLRLVQHLASTYGCRELLFVGNRNRVLGRQLRQGLVVADYDGSWQELGAVLRADGDYALACTPVTPPDLTLIASSKRAEAKRRYAVLRAAIDASCAVFHGPYGSQQLAA